MIDLIRLDELCIVNQLQYNISSTVSVPSPFTTPNSLIRRWNPHPTSGGLHSCLGVRLSSMNEFLRIICDQNFARFTHTGWKTIRLNTLTQKQGIRKWNHTNRTTGQTECFTVPNTQEGILIHGLMQGNKKQVRTINNHGNKGNRKLWPYKEIELDIGTDSVRIRADMKYSLV